MRQGEHGNETRETMEQNKGERGNEGMRHENMGTRQGTVWE